MKDKNIVNYDLAVIAKENVFDEECLEAYIVETKELYPTLDDSLEALQDNYLANDTLQDILMLKNSDIILNYSVTAPTYHQLIDWVFSRCRAITSKEANRKWLEEWYNHLKDCPLKGEFIYRLKEWFRKQNIMLAIYCNASGYLWECHDVIGGTHRKYSGITGPNDSGCWDLYEEAENDSIIEAFKTLKSADE